MLFRSRDVENIKGDARQTEAVALFNELVGRGAGDGGSGQAAEIQYGVGQRGSISLTDDQGDFRPAADHILIAGDVIGVTVRQEDCDGIQALTVDQLENFLRFETGIHDETVAPTPEIHDERVLHEHRGEDDLDL